MKAHPRSVSRARHALLAITGSLGLFAAACRTPENAAPPATAPAAPAAIAPAAPAMPVAQGDAFVLLSGGGTPLSNNYSQYVQARAMAEFFRAHFPREAVWIFFGQGNREGEKPVLADVYRRVRREGLILDTWLPGALPENRLASKENFLRTLRAEILPRVRGGGTLYLFVGDHGELTGGKDPQSAITMWGLQRAPNQRNGWSTARDFALTVSELRAVLAEGLGAGRVVFAMTQCHSGGFHQLGLPAEVQPPASWFARRPAWLAREPAPAALPVAGYSATDQESVAAGCDPDPDPDTWAGYERFLPESLLGVDLLSGAPRGSPGTSFAAAHRAAMLVDRTIDKPRSTAEEFLARWATLIETKLAGDLTLTPAIRAEVAAFQAAVDGGGFAAPPPDAAWRDAAAVFAQFTARMAEQNPRAGPLLRQGSRAELTAAIEQPDPRDDDDSGRPARGVAPAVRRAQFQAWRQTIRPAWNKAVAAGTAKGLPRAAVEFERRLESAEGERGRGFLFAERWPNRVLNDLYWSSTYALPEKFNAHTADTLTRWLATRRATVLRWADAAGDPAVRAAAAKFPAEFRRMESLTGAPEGPRVLPRSTAAERVLWQRRVLAAWAFLIAVGDEPALAQLQALRALERSALPLAPSS